MTVFVKIRVKIGIPTIRCHSRFIEENYPETSSGSPKSAFIRTNKIPTLINKARKSLIIIDEFIAVTLLYLSNFDIFQRKDFNIELIKVITVEIPITAT